MQSISEAAAHLQVGKSRLYALLKDHRIEPRKNGRRKELSDDQVEQLVQIIAAGEPPPERESEAGTAPSSSGGPQLAEDPTAMLLVEELRGQNQVLLEQLRHAAGKPPHAAGIAGSAKTFTIRDGRCRS